MHIQRVANSKSEYRNMKQIQILNAQMIQTGCLPFDIAQGGEPADPFRISNFVLRI
jgi:hypothetical protein